MNTFDLEEKVANEKLTLKAPLKPSEGLRGGESKLELNPATLLFHKVDEKAKERSCLMPQQAENLQTRELTIGAEAFAVRKNSAAPLLEAHYRSVDTALGRLNLMRDEDETSQLAALEKRISQLEERNAELESQVNSDALTGLLNRRGLDSVLTRELSYARRTGNHLLAALVDLDDFKSFNDTYGHDIGDEVLRCVARVMKEKIRACDWSSRVGGDEFLILLPSTALADGLNVLERVRLSICDRTIVAARDLFLRTTVSIGIVRLDSDISTLEDVLRATTRVLKRSKAAGKNRISVDSETEIDNANALSITIGRDGILKAGDPSGRDKRC